VVCASGSALLDVFGHFRTGAVYRPPPPAPAPLVAVVLATAAYAALAPVPRLALPAGIAVATLLATRQAFDASWLWAHAYSRLWLTLPVIAAVACVPAAALRSRRLVGAAAAAVGVAWLAFGWPVVADRTPEHGEYRWVREEIRRLPPECRVV